MPVPARHGGDHLARLSGRAADRLPESGRLARERLAPETRGHCWARRPRGRSPTIGAARPNAGMSSRCAGRDENRAEGTRRRRWIGTRWPSTSISTIADDRFTVTRKTEVAIAAEVTAASIAGGWRPASQLAARCRVHPPDRAPSPSPASTPGPAGGRRPPPGPDRGSGCPSARAADRGQSYSLPHATPKLFKFS